MIGPTAINPPTHLIINTQNSTIILQRIFVRCEVGGFQGMISSCKIPPCSETLHPRPHIEKLSIETRYDFSSPATATAPASAKPATAAKLEDLARCEGFLKLGVPFWGSP